MPMTNQERNDLDVFKEILSLTGPHLPLRFITHIVDHLRFNQRGFYDHTFLCKSLRIFKEVEKGFNFDESETSIALAILFLIETGHSSSEEFPYQVTPGLSVYWLSKYAPCFFNEVDIRFISKNVKPIYPSSMKPSDRTRIQLIVHNVRCLTDIIYPHTDKTVIEFIRLNKVLDKDRDNPIEITEWVDGLVETFVKRYGYEGTFWQLISHGPRVTYAEAIHKFKVIAENRDLIKNLIHQNAQHVFG